MVTPDNYVPNAWFGIGRVWRNTSGGRIVENYLTLRMPWKRRLYCINTDDVLYGHPRLVLRFKFGWVIDA